MQDIDQQLNAAVHAHRSGQLQQAWEGYQRVLQLNPAHGVALNAATLLLRQTGQFQQAVELGRQAVAADASEAAYHANLAEAYRGLGEHAQALECYREAVRLAPDEFAVHFHRATLLSEAGMHDDAIASFRKALELRPHALAWQGLGAEYQRQGRLADAADCFRRAIALEPAAAQPAIDLAALLAAEGQHAEAVAVLEAAARHHPEHVDLLCRLGSALFDSGKLAEARKQFERAIELDPDQAGLHYNLGSVLLNQGALQPAIAAFDRALRLKPDYAEAQCSRGTARLAAGDFMPGWADFEARLRTDRADVPRLTQPRWDGSPLAGRTLLVYGEQGLGDTLQFVRYLRLIEPDGGRLIVAVRPPLVRLLSEAGVGEVVCSDEPLPKFDLWVPMLSLACVFGTQLPAIPAAVPYLHADPARREQWRARLAGEAGLRVGIAWQGAPHFRNDHLRSLPLAALAPLAAVAGVRLISLQKAAGREQLAAATFPILDLAGSLTDLAETAAAIANLDLVICCDTAVAHLAGALAAPVWVALSAAPDWRWLVDRDDSPWYPSLRLFRQTELGQWSDVVRRMATALAQQPARSAT